MWKVALGGVVASISVAITTVAVLPVLNYLDNTLLPVSVGWHVTESRVEGRDLIISGKVAKVRDCAYVPPPRARIVNGQDLLVESIAATAKISWPASPTPRPFGPWRVHGGAGHTIDFYQHHDCHPLWQKTTYLGRYVPPTKEIQDGTR